MRIATALVVGATALAGLAAAQEGTPNIPLRKTVGQVTPTGPVPSLAVLNSAGATLENGKLTLSGVAPNSIVFADRPVRAAGHVMTAQLVMQWDPDKNNFAIDPPNATISVLGGDGTSVSDAVVVLTAPVLAGDTLTFDVTVLEGSLTGATGPAALFIDRFAGGFHGGGFHGSVGHVGDASFAHVGDDHYAGYHGGGTYWHAPAYHGAWYGAPGYDHPWADAAAGAAVGAAAANAYDNYPCGYSPYPPCN